MKKLLISIALAAGTLAGYSQTEPPSPAIDSPIFTFLTQGSNYIVATYGIYDTTTHKFGGGIGAGYKLSEFVVPTLRLDYVDDRLWMPSGSLQLQVPVRILGKVEVSPFVFTGIGTPIGTSKTGEPVGIFGIGAALKLNRGTKASWAIPDYVIGDFERWTGAGLNSNQVRLGVGWRL